MDFLFSAPFHQVPLLICSIWILLGKLNLRAIVYHNGNSPTEGHYFSCVKIDNTWYTCNDHICTEGVKLNCFSTDRGDKIPYLLIYEKGNEVELLPVSTMSHACRNDCVVTWYVGNSFSRPVPTQLKLHFLSSTNSFLANMGHLGLGAVVRNSTESRVPKLGRATQPIPSAQGFQQFSHFCIIDFGLYTVVFSRAVPMPTLFDHTF